MLCRTRVSVHMLSKLIDRRSTLLANMSVDTQQTLPTCCHQQSVVYWLTVDGNNVNHCFAEIAELNDSTVMYSYIAIHVLLQESQ